MDIDDDHILFDDQLSSTLRVRVTTQSLQSLKADVLINGCNAWLSVPDVGTDQRVRRMAARALLSGEIGEHERSTALYEACGYTHIIRQLREYLEQCDEYIERKDDIGLVIDEQRSGAGGADAVVQSGDEDDEEASLSSDEEEVGGRARRDHRRLPPLHLVWSDSGALRHVAALLHVVAPARSHSDSVRDVGSAERQLRDAYINAVTAARVRGARHVAVSLLFCEARDARFVAAAAATQCAAALHVLSRAARRPLLLSVSVAHGKRDEAFRCALLVAALRHLSEAALPALHVPPLRALHAEPLRSDRQRRAAFTLQRISAPLALNRDEDARDLSGNDEDLDRVRTHVHAAAWCCTQSLCSAQCTESGAAPSSWMVRMADWTGRVAQRIGVDALLTIAAVRTLNRRTITLGGAALPLHSVRVTRRPGLYDSMCYASIVHVRRDHEPLCGVLSACAALPHAALLYARALQREAGAADIHQLLLPFLLPLCDERGDTRPMGDARQCVSVASALLAAVRRLHALRIAHANIDAAALYFVPPPSLIDACIDVNTSRLDVRAAIDQCYERAVRCALLPDTCCVPLSGDARRQDLRALAATLERILAPHANESHYGAIQECIDGLREAAALDASTRRDEAALHGAIERALRRVCASLRGALFAAAPFQPTGVPYTTALHSIVCDALIYVHGGGGGGGGGGGIGSGSGAPIDDSAAPPSGAALWAACGDELLADMRARHVSESSLVDGAARTSLHSAFDARATYVCVSAEVSAAIHLLMRQMEHDYGQLDTLTPRFVLLLDSDSDGRRRELADALHGRRRRCERVPAVAVAVPLPGSASASLPTRTAAKDDMVTVMYWTGCTQKEEAVGETVTAAVQRARAALPVPMRLDEKEAGVRLRLFEHDRWLHEKQCVCAYSWSDARLSVASAQKRPQQWRRVRVAPLEPHCGDCAANVRQCVEAWRRLADTSRAHSFCGGLLPLLAFNDRMVVFEAAPARRSATLLHILHSSSRALPASMLHAVAIDCLRSLSYLHGCNVAHGSIGAEYLWHDEEARTHMHAAALLRDSAFQSQSLRNSQNVSLLDNSVAMRFDLYSFACTLLHLMSGRAPIHEYASPHTLREAATRIAADSDDEVISRDIILSLCDSFLNDADESASMALISEALRRLDATASVWRAEQSLHLLRACESCQYI